MKQYSVNRKYLAAGMMIFSLMASCSTAVLPGTEATSSQKKECSYKASLTPLCPEDQMLLDKVIKDNDPLCEKPDLKECTRIHGIDYATTAFFHRLNKQRNASVLISLLSGPTTRSEGGRNFRLGMVPGLFFDANRKIGGDGGPLRKVAREMGLDEEIVPIEPTGSTKLNGGRICAWLETKTDKKIILGTLSKGAADVFAALEQCGSRGSFRNVAGWLNLVGLNQGTLLADEVHATFFYELFAQWQMARYGYHYDGVGSLRWEANASNSAIKIPFPVINVIAAPVKGAVGPRAMENYQRLAKYGPNDGLTLLEHAVIRDALNIAVWGTDHYLVFDDPEPYLRTMLQVLIRPADHPRGGKLFSQ